MSPKSEISLRESNLSDSQRLNQFFSSIAVDGKISIKVRRHVDFFSFYQRLNLEFKNFIFETSKKPSAQEVTNIDQNSKEVLGTASFLFQNRLLNKESVKIALACDLRVSSQRKAILHWSQFFLPELKKLKTEFKIDHFITSINLTEFKVINAFLRPRKTQDYLPVYELIKKFNLVSIHGFLPFLFQTNKNIFVSNYQPSDKEALLIYIKKQLTKYDLVSANISDHLENTIQDSLIYAFQNFIIAKNSKGEIIGCTHPINSSLLQDYLPQKYDQQSNNFRQFLKFASILGFARTLTRPFSRTHKEQTLSFKVLHFLFFDHAEVLKSLIHFTYKNSKLNEFILYAYQDKQYASRPPKGCLYSKTPYALFEIKNPEDSSRFSSLKNVNNFYLDYLWF